MAAPKMSSPFPPGDDLTQLNAKLQEDKPGFQRLAGILKDAAGIHMPVSDKNLSLMASRMMSVLKRRGMTKYRDFENLVRGGDQAALKEMVEALTTNKTDFFREAQHFDLMRQVLPEIMRRKEAEGSRELRVWCAAASTGQEPYTIAMTLLEAMDRPESWTIRFLATDIDTKVLAKAARGVYEEREMDGLSAVQRQAYFEPRMSNGDEVNLINKNLRQMIQFAQFNLMTDPFPFKHPFDLVFCRNVLIYFDRETATGVVQRLGNSLGVGGYLFIGHTESGVPKASNMESVAVAAYRRTK